MGTYHPSAGKFDLVVSVRFSVADAVSSIMAYDDQMFYWRESFQKASELLYSATDGQHQLGRIFLCPDMAASESADIWLKLESGPSSADARIWLEGTHVILKADEKNRPFVITHELGHYLYGLRDEYKGPLTSDASCLGRDAEGKLPGACIMEAAWTDGDRFGAGGVGPYYMLVYGEVTDFCVECNHDRGAGGANCPDGAGLDSYDDHAHDTVQSQTYKSPGPRPYRGTSCWSKMVDHFPELSLPEDRPDPTHPLEGPAGINWLELVSEPRFVVAQDRSERFHEVAPWAWPPLREALVRWLRLARDPERHGAVVFSEELMAWGLGSIDVSMRMNARNIVRSISPKPGTDMVAALDAALQMIVGEPDRSCSQVIVLISGSQHSAAGEPLDLLPQLIRHGVRVYGLAVGPEAEHDRLLALAQGTGGRVFSVAHPVSGISAQTIPGALTEIYGLSHPDEGVITVSANTPYPWDPNLPELPGGGGDSEAFEAFVEEDCEEATFLIFDEQGRDLRLELENPDGDVVDVEEAEEHDSPPSTSEHNEDRRGFLYRVERPSSGIWKARRRPQTGVPTADDSTIVHHMVLARSRRVHLAFSTPRLVYARGETVMLAAKVTAPLDVAGVVWSGEVTDPDGESEELGFQAEEESGLTYATFTAKKEGEYTVRCVADGRGDEVREARAMDEESGPHHRQPGDRILPFLRTGFLRVKVGPPRQTGTTGSPETLMQGESKSISTDLGGVPWVPGVSRLVLGPGIRITEQPARTMADGLASFTIEVERHAAPGIRDGVVRTGGDGFTLPGLVRIEGEEPPPLQISPERRTHPGRFIRRLLKEREEEEGE